MKKLWSLLSTIALCLVLALSLFALASCSQKPGGGSSNSGNNYPTLKGEFFEFGSYPQSEVKDSATITALNAAAGTLPTSSEFNGWTDYEYSPCRAEDYLYDDSFMWYKDISYGGEKYRGVYFTSYRSMFDAENDFRYWGRDSVQELCGYATGVCYWFKYEPLKWRILTQKDGKAFLLCDRPIDSQSYQSSAYIEDVDEDGNFIYRIEYEDYRVTEDASINNYEYSSIRKWLNHNFYSTAFNSEQQSKILPAIIDNSPKSTNVNDNPTF